MNTSTPPVVESNFLQDLRDQFALQLAKEGYLVPPSTSSRDVVLMWFSVRRRHIPRRPRKTVWSSDLRGRRLDGDERHAVNKVVRASEQGKNLNPHLSRRHLTASFNDLLFNDWRIHHMHLGPRGGRRSGRTGELLFVLVTADTLYLLDQLDHHAFGDVRLVEIVHRNFPAVLPLLETEIPPSRAPGPPLTAADRQRAREGGLQVPVEINGRIFISRDRITTSGDSARAVEDMDRVLDEIARIESNLRQSPADAWRNFNRSDLRMPTRLRLKLLVGGAVLTVEELDSGARASFGEIRFGH